MAHVAIMQDGIVVTVVVVANDKFIQDGVEVESKGIDFLKSVVNYPNAIYKQTSYNGKFRGKFAAIGDEWNEELNLFITPNDLT